jgi:aminoglycoside 6'-N-acetyltransferase
MPIREIHLEAFEPELHSQRLRDWLCQPHVVGWWGDPFLALESSLQCSPESCAVIVADGTPVGYLSWKVLPQDELENAGLVDLPAGLVDIDILIGEPELIGCGIGPKTLCILLSRLRLDPVVSVAGVGTSVRNKRAVRAFEKAGFRLFREFQDTQFGPCCYMVVDVSDVV